MNMSLISKSSVLSVTQFLCSTKKTILKSFANCCKTRKWMTKINEIWLYHFTQMCNEKTNQVGASITGLISNEFRKMKFIEIFGKEPPKTSTKL